MELNSPLGHPLKKRTRCLFINVKGVPQTLHRKCKCGKVLDLGKGLARHKVIMGSEAGYKLSTWAQHYPPELVATLVDIVKQSCRPE